MTQTITAPLLLVKFPRSTSVLTFLGIFLFVGLVVSLHLPDQLIRGEQGQLAIQALDAMRRPFLDIKRLEARALGGIETHRIRADFENTASSAHAELASYQQLAQYNPELAMSVGKLAQQYDVWAAAERNLLEQLSSSSKAAGSISERRLRESLYSASTHFLRVMDVLGDGEKPIHTDIDRGREAARRLLSLSAVVLLFLAGILFFHLLRRRRQLELEVSRRTADLVDVNKQLQREIGIRRDAEEKLMRQASHDILTGLPNRRLLYDRMSQAIGLAKRDRHQLALLYLDLDRFKAVNDTLGHDAGDELLKSAAGRIRRIVRESDTVARLGGDEFTVILPKITNRENAAEVARKIIDALCSPFYLGKQKREACVGTSIGIAIYPADAHEVDSLVKAADTAMYDAKQARNTFRFYAAQSGIKSTRETSHVGCVPRTV